MSRSLGSASPHVILAFKVVPDERRIILDAVRKRQMTLSAWLRETCRKQIAADEGRARYQLVRQP